MASTPKPVRKGMKRELSEQRHKSGKRSAKQILPGMKRDIKGSIHEIGMYPGYTKKGKKLREMD